MKLYSDTLTTADLHECLPKGVTLDILPIRLARVRSHGWTVSLTCWGSRRLKNSGTHGAKSWDAGPAASWDQYGEWMAALYQRDPSMKVAYYDSAADFHAKTEGAYGGPVGRLEYLRSRINAESISYGEIAELKSLAEHIEPGDVQLAEWAGIPEDEFMRRGTR